jgi:hypothetical protein
MPCLRAHARVRFALLDGFESSASSVFHINEVAEISILLHKDMEPSVPRAIQEHLDRDAKQKAHIDEIKRWMAEKLHDIYHTHKELQKILRVLNSSQVGNNFNRSMELLYRLADRNVSRGNTSMTVSDALETWDGTDFVFGDTSSEATEENMSDGSIQDGPPASNIDAQAELKSLAEKYPVFFASSGMKRPEPEQSDAAHSEGSASRPEEAAPEESDWTYAAPKKVRNWTAFDSRTGGRKLAFDDDDETPLPVAPEKAPEKREVPAWLSCPGHESAPAVQKETAAAGSSSRQQKFNAETTAETRIKSMDVKTLSSLRISYGLQSGEKTKAALIAQLESHLNNVHNKKGFGIHKLQGNIRSCGHLPQLTLREYVSRWNGKTFEPLDESQMQPPVVVQEQSAVVKEPKPKASVFDFAVSASKAHERLKAKERRQEEEAKRDEEANTAEIIMKQNLSVEERKKEDADAKREMLEKHMLDEKNESLRKSNAYVHDSESQFNGHAYGNLQAWIDDHPSMGYNASASTSDRDQSQKDTMRPFSQAPSPETSPEASIIID